MKIAIHCDSCKAELQIEDSYVAPLGELQIFVQLCRNIDCHDCSECEEWSNYKRIEEELIETKNLLFDMKKANAKLILNAVRLEDQR